MKTLRNLNGVRHQVVDWRDQQNQYPGILAWSDLLWVSADSIGMLAESCATRASVRVLGAEITGGRHRQYIDTLTSRGRLTDTDRTTPVKPIRDTARLAGALLNRGVLLGLGKVPRID